MTELVTVPEPTRLQRAPTILNYMEEFLSVGLINAGQRYVKEARYAITRFIIYGTKNGITNRSISNYPLFLFELGNKRGTVKKNCSTVKRFFHWCYKMGYTKERYYEYFPSISGDPIKEPQIIRHDEYLQLLSVCGKFRDKAWIITLGYNTGFRLGDCCNLCWSNVNLEEQVISVVLRKTARKTGAMANIPYLTNSDLYVAIQERLATKEHEHYVGKDYICPIMACRYNANKFSVSMILRDVFIRAGLAHKKFKDFRSTFESRLANSGMNLSLAARMTGRSDINTLIRYVKMDVEAARDGIAKAMDLHNVYPSFK